MLSGWIKIYIYISDNPRLQSKLIIWKNKDSQTRNVYNPITNAEQSREIEKKLLNLGYCIFTYETLYTILHESWNSEFKAETLELVIYTAALYETEK